MIEHRQVSVSDGRLDVNHSKCTKNGGSCSTLYLQVSLDCQETLEDPGETDETTQSEEVRDV